jgi:Fe-S oxidoreductase
MAAYKSEVLHRTYRKRLRPMAHYSIGWLPRWMKLIGWVPWLVNGLLGIGWIRRIVLPVAGLDARRGLPRFARKPFHRSATAKRSRVGMHRDIRADVAGTTDIPAARRASRVVLWADSFTDGLDPQIPEAIVAVLEDAGFDVFVTAGDACCGVTWISTGQLDGARKRLSHLLETLGPWAVNGVPIIGIEPSCMAVLRSDLLELLPNDPRAHAVAGGTYTFAEVLRGRAPTRPRDGWEPPALDGVTAVVQPHCHQYSVMGYGADRELLARAGATVTEAAGCCGLAGNWGYEKGHYDVSVAVAHNALIPALEAAGLVGGAAPDQTFYLADGVSCRTQAGQLAGVEGQHLAELFASRL